MKPNKRNKMMDTTTPISARRSTRVSRTVTTTTSSRRKSRGFTSVSNTNVPCRKWTQVYRPPRHGVGFKTLKWVTIDELTIDERITYDEELQKKKERKRAELEMNQKAKSVDKVVDKTTDENSEKGIEKVADKAVDKAADNLAPKEIETTESAIVEVGANDTNQTKILSEQKVSDPIMENPKPNNNENEVVEDTADMEHIAKKSKIEQLEGPQQQNDVSIHTGNELSNQKNDL
jgi:hypothetical protein